MSYFGRRPRTAVVGTLDRADPINRGRLAYWTLDQVGGATAFDIAPRKRNGTLTNFSTSGWTNTRFGRALTFDGVDDHIPLTGRWLNNLPTGSFCVRLRPNAGGGYAFYEDGGGFNNFAFGVPSVGTSALTVNIGGNTARNSTVRTWVATTWYDFVVTWGADIRIYVDGLLDTTIAVSGGTANGSGDNDQIGRYSYGGGIAGGYTPATLSRLQLYNRPLLANEAMRLHANPWAGVVVPRTAFWWLGGAGSTTLYVSSRAMMLGAARAAPVGASAVASRGRAMLTGRAAPTGLAPVASRSQAQMAARAAVAGTLPVASRGRAMAIGRAALVGAILAASSGRMQASGRAAVAGTIPVTSRSQVRASAKAAIAGAVLVATRSRTMASARSRLLAQTILASTMRPFVFWIP